MEQQNNKRNLKEHNMLSLLEEALTEIRLVKLWQVKENEDTTGSYTTNAFL